ncbi:hypothetical protein [Nocardioides nanhaiensis]|uniref:Secreted protein n=1 Tax=Nocardioides nanhaiensis TaxID=1476871 RepID=A0ABP8W0Y3_9ACTN
MRPSHLCLGRVLLGVASVPAPIQSASASCAAPEIDVDSATLLQRGTTTTVMGYGFVDGCDDAGTCPGSPGCSGCVHEASEEVAPLIGVPLTLVQGDRRWRLAATDAREEGDVAWTVVLPEAARPGPARLVTPVSQPVRVRLR